MRMSKKLIDRIWYLSLSQIQYVPMVFWSNTALFNMKKNLWSR